MWYTGRMAKTSKKRAPKKRAPSRATLYTPKLADTIIEQIVVFNKTLAQIANIPGMPDYVTLRHWSRLDSPSRPGFVAAYGDAIIKSYDLLEAEIRDIADDDSRDYVKKRVNGAVVMVPDPNRIARHRLQIETRLKIMNARVAAYKPKISVDHTHTHNLIIETRLQNARERLAKTGKSVAATRKTLESGSDSSAIDSKCSAFLPDILTKAAEDGVYEAEIVEMQGD